MHVRKYSEKKDDFAILPIIFHKGNGIYQGNFNCIRLVLFEIQSITRGTAFGVK